MVQTGENNNTAEVPTLSTAAVAAAGCAEQKKIKKNKKAILIVWIQPYKCRILFKSVRVSRASVS